MPRTIVMGEMPFDEIGDAIKAGYINVVVPAGSIEAHGPHLPTTTDNIMATFIGKRVAEIIGHTLVAPVIPLGPTEPMRNFPGTISLRPTVFVDILVDYCRALSNIGIRNIFILSYHGGNYPQIKDAVPHLSQQFPNLNVIGLVGPFMGYREARNEILKMHGITPDEGGNHAGAAETSDMLYVSPDMVRMEKAEKGLVDPRAADIYAIPLAMARGFDKVSSVGVSGDPTKASREIGKEVNKALVNYFATECKKALESLTNQS